MKFLSQPIRVWTFFYGIGDAEGDKRPDGQATKPELSLADRSLL